MTSLTHTHNVRQATTERPAMGTWCRMGATVSAKPSVHSAKSTAASVKSIVRNVQPKSYLDRGLQSVRPFAINLEAGP